MSELNVLAKFRLDEINKIKDYLNSEIKERKDIIKKNSKCIVAFDYVDKLFLTLSASFGTLSIGTLNIIEALMSRALTDFDIRRQEFSKIIYEKNKE